MTKYDQCFDFGASKARLEIFFMKQELPVIQKALDLSKELIPRAAKFPKEYKYILGDRVMGHVLDNRNTYSQAATEEAASSLFTVGKQFHLRQVEV